MTIHTDFSLKNHNSFRVDVKAAKFADVQSVEDLMELRDSGELSAESTFILGGGTNTVFLTDYPGLVVHIGIPGSEKIAEDDKSVTYKFGAGQDWPEMVDYIVGQNLGGVENLALIPGNIGSAPVQNIAAYGQVQEDIFVELEAFEIETGKIRIFTRDECEFKYRTSIFKKSLKGKYIITSVTYRFNKPEHHELELSYHSSKPEESLDYQLSLLGDAPYSISQVSQAIKTIRLMKLPDLREVGTCGSFFLNPLIKGSKLKELLAKYPDMQFYPVDKMKYPDVKDMVVSDDDDFKIPAAWIFDKVLGWAGKRIGDIGVWPKQAICIVNYGNGTAKELKDFINLMKEDFKKETGIELETEVNLIG